MSDLIMSNWGDLVTMLLWLTLGVLSIYYGVKYQQPWKQAKGVMAILMSGYFFAALLDLNAELMRSGGLRLALDLFVLFSIIHLLRLRFRCG